MRRLRKKLRMARKLHLLWESEHHNHPHMNKFFGHHKHHNTPHRAHIHKFYDGNKPLISLSVAQKGEYEFVTTLCDHEMEHRLLEMGFVPQTKIKVIENPDTRGAVLIEIKSSHLALSYKIANDIFVTDANAVNVSDNKDDKGDSQSKVQESENPLP
jgi:Fe2+ transport system protein FeoA